MIQIVSKGILIINTKSTPAIAPILHVFNKKGIILRTIQGSNIKNYE